MSGKSDVRHTLTNRDVEQLSKAALKAEWSETFEQIAAGVAENIDKAWDRRHELWQEMRARTDADPPKCPECAETAGWSQELGGPKECNACGWMPSSEDMDLIEEIDSYWQSVKATDTGQSQTTTENDQ
jgi:Zn ribbon nucleic-acid-binding protein